MNAELNKLLEQLSVEDLRAALQAVHGMDKTVDASIESRLLASDTQALAKHLKKRIASLKRGSRFISWGESGPFSRDMDRLLADIEPLIAEEPKVAFQLADAFMATHEKVLNRCDDSSGSIGDSYSDALDIWLRAAAAWQTSDIPCKLDWRAELEKRHEQNDYAVWDDLISGSLPLLGEATLRRMAEAFEQDALRARAEHKGTQYCSKASRAEIGMRSVAEALGDVELFAHSETYNGEQPNTLQAQSIAQFALAQNDGERALHWLAGHCEPCFQGEHNRLLDQAYQMAGRTDELVQLRRARYESDPSTQCLEALLAVSSAEDQQKLLEGAATKAFDSDNALLAVDTLFALGVPAAAADYMFEFPERIDSVGYGSLLRWSEQFVSASMPLPAVWCYRRLLLDILERAHTKAYSHAAKYYRALAKLDTQIQDYAGGPDAEAFEQQLRQIHGRKSSFWGRVS